MTLWTRGSLEVALGLVKSAQGSLEKLQRSLQYKYAVRYLYKPRADDIFIVTYPKSGTTLMQMMLYQMTSDGSMEIPHINTVTPWFEDRLLRNQDKILEDLPSPRILKSHMEYGQMPPGKYIYVVRDVRDVAVSSWHHVRSILGSQIPQERFLDNFLAGRAIFGSWFQHVESWWPHRKDSNVLFLRYEDVIADLAGTVREVSRFWGVPVSPADLPRIVERCGFAFMKQHNDKFDPRLQLQVSTGGGDFIRKGIRGDGLEVFSPAQNRLLEQTMEKLRSKLDGSAEEPLAAALRT